MQYRLRTLLIVLALGPPVLAGGWRGWQAWREANEEKLGIEIIDEPIASDERLGTTVIFPHFAFPPTPQRSSIEQGNPDALIGTIRRMRQKQQ